MSFAFAVGYVLYTVVPAQGPVYTQVHATNLDLYYTGFVKTQLMDRTRIPRDCFPSLHACVSLIFLWYMLAHVRKSRALLARRSCCRSRSRAFICATTTSSTFSPGSCSVRSRSRWSVIFMRSHDRASCLAAFGVR